MASCKQFPSSLLDPDQVTDYILKFRTRILETLAIKIIFNSGFLFTDFKVEGYPTMVWFHGGDFVRGSPNNISPFQLVLKQKVRNLGSIFNPIKTLYPTSLSLDFRKALTQRLLTARGV